MASQRSVVATRIGGPPEFVTPGAGFLVDPLSVESIEEGMRLAAELPSPNAEARRAASEHDVRRQAERIAELLGKAARAGDGPGRLWGWLGPRSGGGARGR